MNASVATRQLDIPEASIHYEVRGSGPLLALIAAHGGFAGEAPAFTERPRDVLAD